MRDDPSRDLAPSYQDRFGRMMKWERRSKKTPEDVERVSRVSLEEANSGNFHVHYCIR